MILMAGIDQSTADVRVREIFSFTTDTTVQIMSDIAKRTRPWGVVILSTCNRTELYVSAHTRLDLPEALCHAVGVCPQTYGDKFYTLTDRDARIHLCEVACGLKSRVFGEEQILTQVKESIDIARTKKYTDASLETAFRLAVTAAKKARTWAMPKTTKPSSAGRAVEMISEAFGGIAGKRAVVIGSGEMGRLAASLLVQREAIVTITTRRYHTGAAQIPEGVRPIAYEDRFSAMDGADIVISATRCPYFTITLEQWLSCAAPPKFLVDLAMPRDIDSAIESVAGVRCVNIDEIGWDDSDNTNLTSVYTIFEEYADRYEHWLRHKYAGEPVSGGLLTGANGICV
jgi:glutamyl-tRNA reductase